MNCSSVEASVLQTHSIYSLSAINVWTLPNEAGKSISILSQMSTDDADQLLPPFSFTTVQLTNCSSPPPWMWWSEGKSVISNEQQEYSLSAPRHGRVESPWPHSASEWRLRSVREGRSESEKGKEEERMKEMEVTLEKQLHPMETLWREGKSTHYHLNTWIPRNSNTVALSKHDSSSSLPTVSDLRRGRSILHSTLAFQLSNENSE